MACAQDIPVIIWLHGHAKVYHNTHPYPQEVFFFFMKVKIQKLVCGLSLSPIQRIHSVGVQISSWRETAGISFPSFSGKYTVK